MKNRIINPGDVVKFMLDGRWSGKGQMIKPYANEANAWIVKLVAQCKEWPKGTELIINRNELREGSFSFSYVRPRPFKYMRQLGCINGIPETVREGDGWFRCGVWELADDSVIGAPGHRGGWWRACEPSKDLK